MTYLLALWALLNAVGNRRGARPSARPGARPRPSKKDTRTVEEVKKKKKRIRRVLREAARQLVEYYFGGGRLAAVIKRYQEILGVPATGYVDTTTEARVYEILGFINWTPEEEEEEKKRPKKKRRPKEKRRPKKKRAKKPRRKKKREERAPRLRLVNAEKQGMKQPPKEKRQGLFTGDRARVVLKQTGYPEEKVWLRVESRGLDSRGIVYHGALIGTALAYPQLKTGAVLRFRARHVIGIRKKKADEPAPAPRTFITTRRPLFRAQPADPEPAPAPAPAPELTRAQSAARDLRKYVEAGGTDRQVISNYQRTMKRLDPDGHPGPATQARAKKLGFAPRETWRAIMPGPVPYAPTARAAARELLAYLDVYGGKRRDRITAYQEIMGGLVADGIAGPKTRARAEELAG